MKLRYLLPLSGLVAAAVFFLFVFPRIGIAAATDQFEQSESWQPSLAEIQAKVGNDRSGAYDNEAHVNFAQMFQDSYRHHEDDAFGVRFDGPKELRLMGGSQIPRWQLARVAVELKRVSKVVFGNVYDVD